MSTEGMKQRVVDSQNISSTIKQDSMLKRIWLCKETCGKKASFIKYPQDGWKARTSRETLEWQRLDEEMLPAELMSR